MRTDTPKTIYLKDYMPPNYTAANVDLNFDIHPGKTTVTAKTHFDNIGGKDEPLFLNGEDQNLLSVKIDGKDITNVEKTDKGITIPPTGKSAFTLEVVSEIVPEENTALEGLYQSGGNYTTQCEAEGFRKITFFPDQPDIMATYKVRVEADESTNPVLLSNGNLEDKGELENGRHFTIWDDPTPKPCYLFALVAGDLEVVEDTFTTMSGREVKLRIYVRDGDQDQCDHAMESLKKSMKWDEDVYGREYQYDLFNIVAVSDFNMGAMENTSLNIFNTALVLAKPETATDHDYIRVEGVIAHEYFHNWSGNRVTCRDWFQLSLKEGLTVFRDQEFSADMNSRGVQRIDDVSHLRATQFVEDASPLAHPVRPESYIEINNFYTTTIYEKGAEVIRMFHTLLGPATYRKATDLYFDRHDGQAVTIDDWVQAMEDASGRDFSQFKLWYSQAGTPEIKANGKYDPEKKTYTLTLEQSVPDTPGQSNKKPMHMPISVGLIGPNGEDMIGTQILELKEGKQVFTFDNIDTKPVPSILRGFSAPVNLKTDLSDEDYRFLMVNDTDGFNKWESGQRYYLSVIQQLMDGKIKEVPQAFLDSVGEILDQAVSDKGDKALLARSLRMPDFTRIAQEQEIVDPDKIDAALTTLKKAIKREHKSKLEKIYNANRSDKIFSNSPAAMGQRVLCNTTLGLLTATKGTGCAARSEAHYADADNMTDKMAAVGSLLGNKNANRDDVLASFYNEFKEHELVIDKWFSMQARAKRDDIFEVLQKLRTHPDFNIKNPNRVRSLIGAFAVGNPVAFHSPDGRGYEFLKDAIIELNDINPQIASRMITPLREWRRYTPDRQEKMKKALEEIVALPNISPNVYELASKALGQDEQEEKAPACKMG